MADNESLVQAPERRHTRNTADDDYDIRGGNSANSKEYRKRYYSQGEDEFSNLPDDDDQLRGAEIARAAGYNDALLEQRALQNISVRIRFQRNAGRFVLPKEGFNNFASHLQLVQQGDKIDIHFDPAVYPIFDAIIVANANRPDIFDPSHPRYAHYQPLRDNLAVLRNVLMSDYYTRDKDKEFSVDDERYLPNLAEIAHDIGGALNHPKGATRIFAHSVSAELLNIEGEGAARAYDFITERQAGNGFFSTLGVLIRAMFNEPYRNWDLPPREKTPLSHEGLFAAASTNDELCNCAAAQLAAAPAPAEKPLSAEIPPAETTAQTVPIRWQDKVYTATLTPGIAHAG